MTEVKIEPDTGEQDTRYHQRIISATAIKGTLSGYSVRLACGHQMRIYNAINWEEGLLLCTACRDNDELQW